MCSVYSVRYKMGRIIFHSTRSITAYNRVNGIFLIYSYICTICNLEGEIQLRCGEKCFLVEAEIDGKKLLKTINARTHAEARKTIRKEHGATTPIVAVREKRSSR